jgi:hypothetical protein
MSKEPSIQELAALAHSISRLADRAFDHDMPITQDLLKASIRPIREAIGLLVIADRRTTRKKASRRTGKP